MNGAQTLFSRDCTVPCIRAAYDHTAPKGGGGGGGSGPGGIRTLTRDQLLAAFTSANGIDLDPSVVDAIFQSLDPATGRGPSSNHIRSLIRSQSSNHTFVHSLNIQPFNY